MANDAFDNARADKAALAAALAALDQRGQPGPRCTVCALPEELLQVIHEDRAATRPHTNSQLERFLAARKFAISEPTIARHFRKGHNTR